jgi:hypothetical protein
MILIIRMVGDMTIDRLKVAPMKVVAIGLCVAAACLLGFIFLFGTFGV